MHHAVLQGMKADTLKSHIHPRPTLKLDFPILMGLSKETS